MTNQEWEKEFDKKFKAWIFGNFLGNDLDKEKYEAVKSFISNLLQQEREKAVKKFVDKCKSDLSKFNTGAASFISESVSTYLDEALAEQKE